MLAGRCLFRRFPVCFVGVQRVHQLGCVAHFATSTTNSPKGLSRLVQAPLVCLKTMGKMSRAAWRDPRVVGHWMEDIGASIRHGWKWVKNGFKLFWTNLSISKRLVWKSLVGHQLTLRESKLLVTTSTDLFKLVPFSLFIIIPFAELALPIFLRVFPRMLPSTFMERNFVDSASLSRRIRAKKELADFFTQVIEERNRQVVEQVVHEAENEKKQRHDKAAQIEAFQKMVRAGDFPPVTDFVRFATLFEEEFKLENMPIEHLTQICRMLGIEPFGFKSHIVLQLRHTVNRLQTEDRRILWEGVDSLSLSELVEACHSRGMPTVSPEAMKTQLEHWLQLSSNKDVPISLLLWSRTFFVGQQTPPPPLPNPPNTENEDPEELFEDAAERRKERADDVERRLEKLKQMDSQADIQEAHDEEETSGDTRETLLEKIHQLESQLDLFEAVVQKQDVLLASQIKLLSSIQSVPWMQDQSEVHVHRDQVRAVRERLADALTEFQANLTEIENLMKRTKHTDKNDRFYPEDDHHVAK